MKTLTIIITAQGRMSNYIIDLLEVGKAAIGINTGTRKQVKLIDPLGTIR